MVIQSLGRIPAAGKVVTIGEHRITILEADERRIIRIRIEASENTSDTE
jgi:CBS domain containing-hemolysin-like protein